MIKVFREAVFPPGTHQHGWNEVLRLIRLHLHQQSGAKAFLDDFVDISFGDNITDPGIPYRHPWVGMIHNPVHIPKPGPVDKSVQVLFTRPEFIESLACCKALITFSVANTKDIRNLLTAQGSRVPVFTLGHPTDYNVPQFNFDAFKESRRVNSVGFWLRDLASFARLNIPLKKRYILASNRADERRAALDEATAGVKKRDWEVAPRLDHDAYNQALASGVGYADYLACCASNTILEHMARTTPLVVNPLPSICEYLGHEYPLYFGCQAEAETILRDMKLLREGHEYLKERQRITTFRPEWFVPGLRNVLQKVL
jgi:hypothetical protein